MYQSSQSFTIFAKKKKFEKFPVAVNLASPLLSIFFMMEMLQRKQVGRNLIFFTQERGQSVNSRGNNGLHGSKLTQMKSICCESNIIYMIKI